MLKGRRVGTFTAGVTLIAFGVLFLLHTVNAQLDYQFIFKLWPIILILLGIEIIIAYIVNREDKIRYDSGAIAIIIILAFFVMGMGTAQFIIENFPNVNGHHIIIR